jgi:Flagellar biosynthesis protein, FliO
MQEWIQITFGNNITPAAAYIIVFLLTVAVIYILIRILRAFSSGTFVAGGKSRHLRLAIMDATPVDAHRRLVLVRRDDVEHLILIGGPTDIVVEQNIRLSAQPQTRLEATPAKQTPITQPVRAQQAPVRQENQAQQPASRQYTPVPAAPVSPAPVVPLTTVQPATAPRPITAPPVRIETPAIKPELKIAVIAGQNNRPAQSQAITKPDNSDESLFADLSYEIDKAAKIGSDNDISLEDEMEGLLASLDTKVERIT